MEIVIGATRRIGPPPKKASTTNGTFVEAKVLNVRSPRRRVGNSPEHEERRHNRNAMDPAGGRVMTLMIPNGYTIPMDIESGNYRVFLRFVPQKQ